MSLKLQEKREKQHRYYPVFLYSHYFPDSSVPQKEKLVSCRETSPTFTLFPVPIFVSSNVAKATAENIPHNQPTLEYGTFPKILYPGLAGNGFKPVGRISIGQ
jgi:hypothetical protein